MYWIQGFRNIIDEGLTVFLSTKPFIGAVALDAWKRIPIHSSPIPQINCPIFCMMLGKPLSLLSLKPPFEPVHTIDT